MWISPWPAPSTPAPRFLRPSGLRSALSTAPGPFGSGSSTGASTPPSLSPRGLRGRNWPCRRSIWTWNALRWVRPRRWRPKGRASPPSRRTGSWRPSPLTVSASPASSRTSPPTWRSWRSSPPAPRRPSSRTPFDARTSSSPPTASSPSSRSSRPPPQPSTWGRSASTASPWRRRSSPPTRPSGSSSPSRWPTRPWRGSKPAAASGGATGSRSGFRCATRATASSSTTAGSGPPPASWPRWTSHPSGSTARG